MNTELSSYRAVLLTTVDSIRGAEMAADTSIYHGARQTFRCGNSRVISLPPGPLCKYQVVEGEGGVFVLLPVAENNGIIEVP